MLRSSQEHDDIRYLVGLGVPNPGDGEWVACILAESTDYNSRWNRVESKERRAMLHRQPSMLHVGGKYVSRLGRSNKTETSAVP